MQAQSSKNLDPWYRQGWPWFLIAIPATAVVAGAVTLWLAVQSWDGLVVDDYYQQGKTIQTTIARTERANEMGLAADLTIRAEEVRLQLAAKPGTTLPPTVVLTIAHPTRSGHDQVLLLKLDDGAFAGPLEPLAVGRWLIQLEDESRTWRLNGTVYLPTETRLRMLPGIS
ncbi:FixH family protein [Aromatoleum sp.]|uniref:FixH family protein n=1 Tax=Aromatoleum sp. TaxID=2307007 RepID=UPI002FCA9726